ncbi:ABC transporter permease [Ulvibacterium sp.]|uniref:ABC transporter permease n=1 Tax=Ulvibacterium sp. TaxID=2665914 RepID=UPI003BACB55D
MINILGLSTGLASVLLIYLWVHDELSMDKFHESDDQLYQVMINYHFPDGIVTDTATPSLLAASLTEEMPEVEYATQVNSRDISCEGILVHGDKKIKAGGLFAGRDFFQMFSYDLVQGNGMKVLEDKNSIVISKRLATSLFGTTDNVVGKSLRASPELYGETFQVSGVFETVTSNSTAQFDFVVNFEILSSYANWVKEWTGDSAKVYLILKKGTNVDRFNEKIFGYLKSKGRETIESTLFVRKYSEGYLYGRYENGKQTGGRVLYVRLFSIIALLILVIACINFVNLSTAQASRKMKEIGIKKAMGANRVILGRQFLGNSILMSIISFALAVVLVILFLPRFNGIIEKNLNFALDSGTVLVIMAIVLSTGLISGSYPAFYLSGFHPSSALRGENNTALRGQWIRKGLVITQFSLSVVFIVAFLVMNKQIEYAQKRNLGYARDNLLHFQIKDGYDFGPEVFMNELRNVPGIVNATNLYGGSIVGNVGGGTGFSWQGMPPGNEDIEYLRLQVGYDLIKTMGAELLEGRDFSREYSNEGEKLIVNEAAADIIGYEGIIGKTIRDINREKQIIGVVKNFNIESLHNEMRPCFIRFEPKGKDVMVRLKKGEEMAAIRMLTKFYEGFHQGHPFEYSFLDDDYNNFYVLEHRTRSLSKYATFLAILISCLGLFGLAVFATEKRRKEISIRKVLGQSTSQIALMLSGEFVKPVLISILIALPTAYLLAEDWLSGFAYRTTLQVWVFLGAGLAALVIAMLTVSGQAIRATNKNPVDGLRDE